jgi:predicted nucleic acid-binding protein
MNKILLDTDVILDFFFDRSPFAENAAKILTYCENKKISGYVTPVILSNIYYLLRKTANHQQVIAHLKMLLTILEIASVNKTIVLKAIHSDFNDFEDALQNFTAENEKGIRIIVTRNFKDYKTSKLSVMTPELYLNSIQK